MMIQQSNCFVVVERGRAMNNMMQERALAGGGEMRGGSNIGGGSTIGAIAGGLKFKEAQTSMLVADARSGVQVAAAEGSSKKADLALGGLVIGGVDPDDTADPAATRGRPVGPRPGGARGADP